MILTPATIKSAPGSRRKSKRLGRGNASQKGTYAGRGLKGQRGRSSGKRATHRRGFKASLQKIPKLRGFKGLRKKKETITLAQLEKYGESGKILTPAYLKKQGAVNHPERGVKIVATGELKKKLEIRGCLASKKALEAIEKAGGKITF